MSRRGVLLTGPGGFAKPLMLDLDSLQPARDDPLLDADTMLQQKRDKLAAFDKQCSKVMNHQATQQQKQQQMQRQARNSATVQWLQVEQSTRRCH